MQHFDDTEVLSFPIAAASTKPTTKTTAKSPSDANAIRHGASQSGDKSGIISGKELITCLQHC